MAKNFVGKEITSEKHKVSFKVIDRIKTNGPSSSITYYHTLINNEINKALRYWELENLFKNIDNCLDINMQSDPHYIENLLKEDLHSQCIINKKLI